MVPCFLPILLQGIAPLNFNLSKQDPIFSDAALRRNSLTISESVTTVRDMALLLYQAQQQLHYEGATMIMRLKSKMQDLEEQLSNVNALMWLSLNSPKTLTLGVIIFLATMMKVKLQQGAHFARLFLSASIYFVQALSVV